MKSNKIILLLIFIFSSSANIISQTKSGSEWEIIAGRAYGRFHQYSERFTVKSNGETSYFNKSNKNENRSERGKISPEQISQISEMLTLINLPAAKKIPDDKYNACIMSPHLPNVYFTLKQNDKTYSLTHCNGASSRRIHDYTLILSASKKQIYEDLRKTVTSLFAGVQGQLSEFNR